MDIVDAAGRWREGRRIFGINAAFDGMAGKDNVALLILELGTGGDANLLLHQIEAGQHLGHRMLDLQAGIHLNEIEFDILVKEFDGADALIAELLHRPRDAPANRFALRRIEGGGMRFIPHILMAPLQGAVAFAEMDRIALAIAEDLDFDMARPLEIFFEIDITIAERRLRFCLRRLDRILKVGFGMRDLHASPTAAGRRLDQHRIADISGGAAGLADVVDTAFRSGNDRYAEFLGGSLGFDLIAHDADMGRGGADELDFVLFEDLGEAGIFGEEAIARMHRFGAGDLAGRHDRGNIEIAVARRRRADAHALIVEPDMHRFFIRGRMDGDRMDAEFAAGAHDAKGDLAAIGDEDLVKHARYSISTRASPYSTGLPFC